MSIQPLSPHQKHSRIAPFFALLTVLGLFSLILTATGLFEGAHANDRAAATMTPLTAGTAGKPWNFWYIHHSQWRADARSVVAAVRFLLEPDSLSQLSRPATTFEVARPTNSASVSSKSPERANRHPQVG